MNTIELKQYLLNMYRESMSNGTMKVKNILPVFHVAVIDCIIRQYLTTTDYYEEHAIKTYSNFLKTGNIIW